MRKTQQNKRKKNKNLKGKSKHLKNKLVIKKVTSTLVKKRWVTRKKTFSPYPYIITIGFYRRNVFFTVADILGHTKG
jgi:hypothetical protein